MADKTLTWRGKMSVFGGPADHGVGPAEGLALVGKIADCPGIFLPKQPPGTTGLARRLDPLTHYIACRWDYRVTPQKWLLGNEVTVTNPVNGKTATAQPADWGPAAWTGRVADLSPGLAAALGLTTGGVCCVVVPLPR